MLAYFCPKLKTINNQYFDDACSDFTIRVIQEARAIMEPYVCSHLFIVVLCGNGLNFGIATCAFCQLTVLPGLCLRVRGSNQCIRKAFFCANMSLKSLALCRMIGRILRLHPGVIEVSLDKMDVISIAAVDLNRGKEHYVCKPSWKSITGLPMGHRSPPPPNLDGNLPWHSMRR